MRMQKTCPACGDSRTPLAYARALQVAAYTPAYRRLSREHMRAAYQLDQLDLFRKLMDYDKVLIWAKTTPLKVVGWTQHRKSHPLRWYLNTVSPATNGLPRWDIYLSACEALARFPGVPHTGTVALLENFRVLPDVGATFILYCPLPAWTRALMSALADLPYNAPITREHFLTLLRAYTR